MLVCTNAMSHPRNHVLQSYKLQDPLLWALARDFQRAGDVLLGSGEFSYLQDRFAARKNPMGTKMHYALASLEDYTRPNQVCLNQLIQTIDNLFRISWYFCLST